MSKIEQFPKERRYLTNVSGSSVEDFYNTCHKECCLGNKGLPAPRSIQQLVTAWKLLWKWKWKRKRKRKRMSGR
jgi:hypothetical protein